jgi:hypothetical protein
MDDIDPDKHEAALLARLEAEREQRLAEKIAAGEIVRVPLYVVAGSFTEAARQAEEAKAQKLAELRATGDQREVVFAVTVVITGVCQHGEAADPASVPSAPSFTLREDAAIRPSLPRSSSEAALPRSSSRMPDEDDGAAVVKEEAEEPQPPIIEMPICVQVRQCVDADDPGGVREGWYSVEGKSVTVTDTRGKYVGSRTVVAGGKTPEAESFNRRLDYPNAGLA